MQFLSSGFVPGVQRWDIQRSKLKGARAFMLVSNPVESSDIVGLRVIQPSMDYDKFEDLRYAVPGFYEMLIQSSRGAGNRDTERLLTISKDGEYTSKRLSELFNPIPGKSMPDSHYKPVRDYVTGLAVGASCYSMEDETTRRLQEGGSVTFLQPVVNSDNDNYAGWELFNVNIAYSFFDELRRLTFPGEYRFRSHLIARSRGRPGMFITGVEGDNTFTVDRFNAFFGFTKSSPLHTGSAAPVLPVVDSKVS